MGRRCAVICGTRVLRPSPLEVCISCGPDSGKPSERRVEGGMGRAQDDPCGSYPDALLEKAQARTRLQANSESGSRAAEKQNTS